MIEGDEIKEKIKTYSKFGTILHILLNNGRFYNGTIELITVDFFMFKDRLIPQAFPVFFSELKEIEPFREMRDGN